ncbi:uncharacterized protein MKK02DRAFT_39617 [Dioszegia hungarica]|uniref:GATA-type domain-containing protein n=1 Tax=Dioszegia hungarica TaxID=4972 RepID=A0AA38HGU1_9TREE|nr:uncharacterized protein MKK02DRAFT_39617 [Dioszegia hungarica]KAI9639319.1 hypothetical protein MKK02DRAFT_39617 [Dioszegia hungarica]
MVNIPSSNKIHALPVLVNYHLPSSSSCFTALFPAPQQVYVHVKAASKVKDGEDETWGSIPLKAVVQGVMLASPELHPFDSSTPDRSLYVLDARETFLRRQRNANIPLHLRSDRASSPACGSSPPPPGSASAEVWSGKGLVSWALAEPGQGKNLITGRLIQSMEFAAVGAAQVEGMDALEALMIADGEGCWGLEVNISMRPQGGPMTGPLGGQGARAGTPVPMGNRGDREASVLSEVPFQVKREMTPSQTVQPTLVRASTSTRILSRPTVPHTHSAPAQPSSTPAASSSSRKTRVASSSGSKKRKATAADDRALANISTNSSADSIHRAVRDDSHDPKFMIPSIPAAIYNNPSSLTKDQVNRLLASPAFLDLLEKTAGQPIVDAATKKEQQIATATAAKRVKHDHGDECGTGENKCYNCGRTKSSVWRSRTMEDGSAVRVCNACGLYWNQRKEMRPPALWSAVDDDVTERPRSTNPKPIIPRNPPIHLTARAAAAAGKGKAGSASSSTATFKRTLSAVVEEDAKRIASRRPSSTTPAVRSNLNPARNAPAPAPATSPAQSTRAKTMRNASWKNPQGNQVASSPGGWVNPDARAVTASEAFEPVASSAAQPASGSRGFNTQSGIQSLQLPQSEDQFQIAGNWDTDHSTLFDFEAFEQRNDKAEGSHHGHQQPLRRSPRKHIPRSHGHGHGHAPSDTDPLSGFYPTSTAPGPSSPRSNFDFSALPPSSPPFIPGAANYHVLGPHANAQGGGIASLLMSSPDFSPSSLFGPSPTDSNGVPVRLTPEKNKSGLRNSFTPIQEGREGSDSAAASESGVGVVGLGVGMEGLDAPFSFGADTQQVPEGEVSMEDITKALNESGMDQAAWDELYAMMNEVIPQEGEVFGMPPLQPLEGQGQAQKGQVGGGDGLDLGAGEDWAALFNFSQE